MHAANPQINPGSILQTAFGFWSSKVLLTAVEFGVFTKLGDRRLSGAALGAELIGNQLLRAGNALSALSAAEALARTQA